MKLSVLAIAAAALIPVSFAVAQAETFGIETLDLSQATQDWGQPGVNRTVDSNPLKLGGRKFDRGFGTHAVGVIRIDLAGGGERFTATVGVDDEVGQRGSVVFSVSGDGKALWQSGVMRGGQGGTNLSVSLAGVKTLVLSTTDAGDGIDFDHADWADAQIVMTRGKPKATQAIREPAVVLTPKPSPKPRINGARVFGVRPGSPVLFTVPVSGNRPIAYSARDLPAGIELDSQSGRLTGQIKERGTYTVTLRAQNTLGAAERTLKIVCGDTIALTPPMGWNSWNCFGCDVKEADVRAAADAMVESGLINHGWTYINIDDCWQGQRDADGNILCNKKFPDMKKLADYVHGKGLKIGIYSSPGPQTCAGHTGSYQHVAQDARQYAEWGFDYLKYDWCSYNRIVPKPDHAQLMKPYQEMTDALRAAPRDIVHSLCQYGMGNVWEWGAEVGGNCWRTTGDITDTWNSMAGIGFGQAGHEKYAAPGHWNDPDMLVVGYVGWSAKVRPTRLTPNEQYTHISLWCLLASPLLIGCDMTRLDEFTLSLLTNDEVIDVNQDPLGRQAGRVSKDGNLEVWAKDMEDGSKVVGLFNRGEEESAIVAKWGDLGLAGKQKVRDLWRQQDLPAATGSFEARVPRHGVVLVKLAPAN